eukprot:jgi/Mesen1/8834/ME000053S08243
MLRSRLLFFRIGHVKKCGETPSPNYLRTKADHLQHSLKLQQHPTCFQRSIRRSSRCQLLPFIPRISCTARDYLTMDLPVKEHVTNFAVSAAELEGKIQDPNQQFILIILNYTLPSFTPVLWQQAKRLRMCADGGANRLFDEMPLLFPKESPDSVRRRFVPDVIKGDLDSLRPEVADFYRALGCRIVDLSEDQDSTDLHKCVAFVLDTTPEPDRDRLKVLVVGALGGRFDHEAGNMHVLFCFPQLAISLLSDDNLVALLPRGFRHVIRPRATWQGPKCGLIPLGAPSLSTTSTGLQWNLDARPMSFGTLVSTCNEIVSDEVTVESDVSLIWTTEVQL